MIEFEIIDDEPSKKLTLPERAQVALGSAKHEVELRELVKASESIVAVTNIDGREQAHRAGMGLKYARTTISKTGKASRQDAQDFSKAVIAEEARLIGIIEPEENRIFALRDGFDDKVKAEKDAAITAERARKEKIDRLIFSLRDYPRSIVASDPACLSATLKAAIDEFDGWVPHADCYHEFVPEATSAIAESLTTMRTMYETALCKENAEAKAKQDRETEAARVKAQADENARMKAELDAQREAMEKAAKQAADAARAEARRVLEEQTEARRVAAALQAEEDAKRQAAQETMLAAIRDAQVELDRKQAEIDAAELQRKRDDEIAADIRRMDESDDAAIDAAVFEQIAVIEAVNAQNAMIDLADAITDNAVETWPESVYFQAGDFDDVEDFYEYCNDDGMPNGLTSQPTHCTYVKYIRSDIVEQMINEVLSTLGK